MYAMLSIHKPHPEHEAVLIDSMHRFGDACRTQPGLIQIGTFKNPDTGQLVGIALWDSAESAKAAAPVFGAAVAGDDFETWEAEEVQGMRLVEV